MAELLRTAGFVIRGRRADCARCTGRSRGTVTFNDEVAHCFRCGWKANTITLERELGLARGKSAGREEWAARMKHNAERKAKTQTEEELAAFAAWRDARIRKFSNRYYRLGQKAVLAERVLQRYPDCEPAWEALKRFHDEEPRLLAQLDFLMCTKVSQWLEMDSTVEQVFQYWKEQVRCYETASTKKLCAGSSKTRPRKRRRRSAPILTSPS